jgi:hypothetical protein
MSNSFYYFFSATPQVLAAILALFGVFVVFKLQSLQSRLVGIGQTILGLVESTPLYYETLRNTSTSNKIRKAIQTNDIKLLREYVNSIDAEVLRVKSANEADDKKELKTAIDLRLLERFNPISRNYKDVYDARQYLIRDTVRWSIFTAISVVFCLSIIPFGDLILKNIFILYTLYNTLIVCLIISFLGLISILRRALIDS